MKQIEAVDGGARVQTDEGTWSAPVVVVAAGGWVTPLLGELVELPPLSVTLATPSHFVPRDGLGAPWPSVVHHEHGDRRARLRRVRGVGARRRDEGRARERQASCQPDDRPREVPPEALADLVAYVQEWFPGLDPAPVDPHTCLFTSTPDEHFVLDRQGPLVVVSPCSGHGFKFVPAIGRLAADLAESPEPDAASVVREECGGCLPDGSVSFQIHGASSGS